MQVDMDLGFPGEREAAWLTNRYFPSKVGGRPAWLDLDKLPKTKEELQCKDCGNPKTFLCQIYAPYEDEHNFHRSIFLFVCRSTTCQKPNNNGNIAVFRSQLPRENIFYSASPPAEDGKPLDPLPCTRKLCFACGCLGPLSCSRCKKANYCSPVHQKAHWSQHKKVCSADSTESECLETLKAPLPTIVLPEWEIVIESNEGDDNPSSPKTTDNESDEQQRLADYEKLVADGKAGDLQNVDNTELEKYTQGADLVEDKYFGKFKKATAKEPDQILRYKRNGTPLWITDPSSTIAQQLEIPNCENCGGPRQYEFQIMPQMLLLLKDDQLDWGVLAVYTCAASCQPKPDQGYLPEYVVKQDLVEETKEDQALGK